MALNRFAREKDDNYSTICNRIMKEKNISLKAKGLYALVMSLPPKWDFSVQGIVAISKEESGAIYTAIKELIKEGYCERNMISEKGRFIGCEYKFFNKKKKPQEKEPHNEKPYRDFPHTENEEDNKLFNESNSSSINTPTELNKNKKLSNDNQKIEYSEEFENFWKLYGYSKGKQRAYGKWNKLSDTDKQKAIDAIPAYLEDCARCKRDQQHAATYLFNHTFEDDFSAKPKRSLYDPIDGEDEQKTRFKRWMRANFPEIEATALPLSYEDYMELVKGDHIEDVTNALTNIHNEIYKYRRSDIAQVIKAMLPKEDD
jgi:hypothetical protein